jgi:hypothetical protein
MPVSLVPADWFRGHVARGHRYRPFTNHYRRILSRKAMPQLGNWDFDFTFQHY